LRLKAIYDQLSYRPCSYPLFARVVQTLASAPSSRLRDEDEIVSLAVDVCDYLVTDGVWQEATPEGRTRMVLDDEGLRVFEERGEWHFQNRYPVHS
jgi:hypothetical protein